MRGGAVMDETGDDAEEDLVHIELCPSCGTWQIHEILSEKNKGGGTDYKVRCEGCSHIYLLEVRPPKEVRIKFTLSDGAHSIVEEIEVDEDETIYVNDVFDHDDKLWRVTQLHLKQEQSVQSTQPNNVVSAWAVRCDLVRIKITMTEGEESRTSIKESDPEEIFVCGSIIEFEGRKWRIRAIHTGRGRTLTGRREASQIRRIYLHPPPEPRRRFRRN